MTARRAVAAAGALLATVLGVPPSLAGTAAEPLVIRGRLVDADGRPVAGARLTADASYSLALGSDGSTISLGRGAGGYPGCTQNCHELPEKTDADGRFEVDAPASILENRDRIEVEGRSSGFSVTAYAPLRPGQRIGPVVRVTHQLERGDEEITLPEMRLWRPEMRHDVVAEGQVRLRWSQPAKSYGRLIGGPGAGTYPPGSVAVRATGPAAARIDLAGMNPGTAWVLSATAQIGDESNVTYGSRAAALPAPPPPATRGRPCLVLGTGGSTARGPCALTDGDEKSTPGRVFAATCGSDGGFCEPELPAVSAVDLGSEQVVTLVRAEGECMFMCEVVVSFDGSTWREIDEAGGPPPEDASCPGRRASSHTAVSRERIVPPPGTRARYVGLTAMSATRIPRQRGIVRPLPGSTEPFDPESVRDGLGEPDAVNAAEITVWTATGGAIPVICAGVDEELPPLGAPEAAGGAGSQQPRERREPTTELVAKVSAGLVAFAAVVAVVRTSQRRRAT